MQVNDIRILVLEVLSKYSGLEGRSKVESHEGTNILYTQNTQTKYMAIEITHIHSGNLSYGSV